MSASLPLGLLFAITHVGDSDLLSTAHFSLRSEPNKTRTNRINTKTEIELTGFCKYEKEQTNKQTDDQVLIFLPQAIKVRLPNIARGRCSSLSSSRRGQSLWPRKYPAQLDNVVVPHNLTLGVKNLSSSPLSLELIYCLKLLAKF